MIAYDGGLRTVDLGLLSLRNGLDEVIRGRRPLWKDLSWAHLVMS